MLVTEVQFTNKSTYFKSWMLGIAAQPTCCDDLVGILESCDDFR